jgi:hypothetical protein
MMNEAQVLVARGHSSLLPRKWVLVAGSKVVNIGSKFRITFWKAKYNAVQEIAQSAQAASRD